MTSNYEGVVTQAQIKEIKNQVFANHRLIEQLQRDNRAQAVMINRLISLANDDGK